MMTVRIRFEPGDLWLGAFIEKRTFMHVDTSPARYEWSVYVCLLPCLPIRFRWERDA